MRIADNDGVQRVAEFFAVRIQGAAGQFLEMFAQRLGVLGRGLAEALELDDDDRITWVSKDETLRSQPDTSFMQRLEDWFFSHLPLEGEL